MGRQEATRSDYDEDCIRIGEFPCCSHYAERLARVKQVPIFKVLVRPCGDANHVEPRPTGHEASALPTRQGCGVGVEESESESEGFST